MIRSIYFPLYTVLLGVVRPGRLRWLGPSVPKLTLGRQDLGRAIHPLGFHWGWVLLLAIALVLAMGEINPAASAIASIP